MRYFEFSANILADLSPEEWRCVCDQLDLLDASVDNGEVDTELGRMPDFEKMVCIRTPTKVEESC